MSRHPNEMTADELRELVFAMSWAALDLAQHLSFTNDLLKAEHKKDAYKSAEHMAGEICQMPYAEATPERIGVDVVVFGKNGLERP